MPARVTPYLNFSTTAREAMSFYQSVFGGDLTIATFADLGKVAEPPERDLVAHAMLRSDAGIVLMGSDTPDEQPQSSRVALGGDIDELSVYWSQLSADGTVTVPLADSAWGSLHGQCIDRFGTTWLVNATGRQAASGPTA